MNKEEVDMDNPAFAQQDPHLKIEDDEDQAGLPAQFRNRQHYLMFDHVFQRNPRRPPLFDAMLNNIRAITKKVEHIKGFKFEVSGALSNNFHISHSWNIPNGSPKENDKSNPMQQMMKPPAVAQYTLGAQYLGGAIRTPFDQPAYIMTGRMDSAGKLEAALIKKINDWISFRFSAFYMNSDPMNSQMHVDFDFTGADYVHTIKWGTGLMSFNHMQTIGNRLVLGYEMMNLTERKATLMSYAAKYILNKRQMIYAQYIGAADQLVMAYNHKLLDKAYLVSEFNYQNQTGETNYIVGFRQKFLTSEVIATINSKMKMSTILSMNGMAYQLKLCAIADYLKDSYKFGYGIAMGQV